VEACHADMEGVPWAHFGSTFISSGPHKQYVALPYGHILGFLAGFKFVGCDRVAWFKPFDPSETRNIEKHSASNHAFSGNHDAALRRACAFDSLSAVPVVHLSVDEDMTQGINVGRCHSMERNSNKVTS